MPVAQLINFFRSFLYFCFLTGFQMDEFPIEFLIRILSCGRGDAGFVAGGPYLHFRHRNQHLMSEDFRFTLFAGIGLMLESRWEAIN